MQFAKDSFYMALRARLATVNPGRTLAIGGATRPAVVVDENEYPTARPALPDCFHLQWGEARTVAGMARAQRPLMQAECRIFYRTSGDDSGATRGRSLAEFDLELLQMCTPPRTAKCDFTHTPEVALGGTVFWSGLEFLAAESKPGELQRNARLLIFFFPEVDYS